MIVETAPEHYQPKPPFAIDRRWNNPFIAIREAQALDQSLRTQLGSQYDDYSQQKYFAAAYGDRVLVINNSLEDLLLSIVGLQQQFGEFDPVIWPFGASAEFWDLLGRVSQ